MRLICLFTTALLLTSALPARAEIFLSAGGGVFDPWEGSVGYELDASVMTTIWKIKSLRLGGEFSYRSAEGEIIKVHNVDFDSYRLSFVAHYRPLLGWFLEPYLGGRVTTAINDSRDEYIERARPEKRVHDTPYFGLGAAAIAGIDIPFGNHFTVYGETSFGADLLLINAHHDTDTDAWLCSPNSTENIGGVTGTAGVRVRF